MAVIAPVSVMCSIRAAGGVMVIPFGRVLPSGHRKVIVRLPTGVRVVPAAPKHRVGEQHCHC